MLSNEADQIRSFADGEPRAEVANSDQGSMPSQRLVVVLPVYNEVDSIAAVLAEIHEAGVRLSLAGVSTEVLLVDDESPDGTETEARAFADRVGLRLSVLVGRRDGLGSAMLRGFAEALTLDPTAIVTLDGDGQHNPADIPTLYRAFLSRKADIAIGSRWIRGGSAPGTSLGRAAGSRFGNWAFRVVSGTRGVKDATTSFRVYSPSVVEYLLSTGSERYRGYSFFSTTIGLAEAAGFSITEVPIEFRPRYSGYSKLNRKEVWRYFASMSRLRDERRTYTGNEAVTEYKAKEEIQLLRDASNWNDFVIDASLEHLPTDQVNRLVEVGAGLGGITTVLRRRFPTAEIVAVEPDQTNHQLLIESSSNDHDVHVRSGTLFDHLAELEADPADLVVYVNVLEHIRDDVGELKCARNVLTDHGSLAVFVPAMKGLYGPIDTKSGHFRRYGPDDLRATVERAGFEIVHLDFAERLGVMPYWLNYRLLNKSTLSSGSAKMFDNVYVPVMSAFERGAGNLPFGKNLVCLARKAR